MALTAGLPIREIWPTPVFVLYGEEYLSFFLLELILRLEFVDIDGDGVG